MRPGSLGEIRGVPASSLSVSLAPAKWASAACRRRPGRAHPWPRLECVGQERGQLLGDAHDTLPLALRERPRVAAAHREEPAREVDVGLLQAADIPLRKPVRIAVANGGRWSSSSAVKNGKTSSGVRMLTITSDTLRVSTSS